MIPLLAVGQGFHGELTGRENVALFAASLGVPRKTVASRMDAVSAFAELERHMDTPVKRYSSGMISRLSFSIAMQFPADIYVFDEVLAVVDGEFQGRCLDAIKSLHREGSTVFFVSHNPGQVAEVCEETMWLERGVVRDRGRTPEVLEAYARVHGALQERSAPGLRREGALGLARHEVVPARRVELRAPVTEGAMTWGEVVVGEPARYSCVATTSQRS